MIKQNPKQNYNPNLPPNKVFNESDYQQQTGFNSVQNSYPDYNYNQNPNFQNYQIYNNQAPYNNNQNINNPNQFNTPNNPNNSKLNQLANFLKAKKWFVLSAILLLVIVLISSAIFVGNNQKEGINTFESTVYDNVQVSINAPNTLPQGTPGDWEIEIENFEDVAISNLKLVMAFDDGFVFLREYSPSPDDNKGTTYSIPRLDPKGGRTSKARVRFQGYLRANIDIETIMQANLSYVPDFGGGNVGEVFQVKSQPTKTKVTSPQVKINLEPTRSKIENGNQIELVAVIENISDQEIRNLRLKMIYPRNRDSFTYISSEYMRTTNTAPVTRPDQGDDTWEITRLPSGSRQTLKVVGNVFGSDNSRLTFGTELSIQTQGNNYEPIWTGYRDVTIVAQPLMLQTSILGKENSGLIIPGETLSIELKYQNQSNMTLNNVEIFSFLEDPANMLDLSTIQFAGGERGDLAGSELVWKSPRVPTLATLLPKQSGNFRYSVKVKDTVIDNRLNQQQYILIPGIRARAKDLSEIASTGSTYRTKGLFVFESPKPQKVGENKTTNSDIYRVIWRISNSQNEVTEAEVRAVLPVVGAWNNSTVRPSSAKSSISHNEATGEIVWRIGRVESYTGMVRTPIEISFDLEIPRGEKELLRNLKGSGIDVFTGERFEENRGNISP